MGTRWTPAVIIGAGPSGLATAACLKREGVPFELLERRDTVGSSWRNHYERLHLHTVKRFSSLPYLAFPKRYPRYPSRDQVVSYLDAYADHFGLRPILGVDVRMVSPGGRRNRWVVETADAVYQADNVVVATGYNSEPKVPSWPNQEAFDGQVIHASEYRTARPYKGQRVLVVGVGNTGGEIAIDLWEQGATPSVVVRSPIHVIPREVLGMPAQVSGLLLGRFPTAVGDAVGPALARQTLGDLSAYGIQQPEVGPVTQVETQGRIPLLDIGTIHLIKQGHLTVVPDIESFTETGVRFSDGAERPFDAVILATGYRPRLDHFLRNAAAVTDARGYPTTHAPDAARPGLFFVGYRNPITGALHDIAKQARALARRVAAAA